MSYMPTPSQPQDAVPMPGYDPFSSLLHTVIAKEIREMRDKLEGLSMELVEDEYFATNFLEQLQTFDYLIQHAEECVNLLDRIAAGENSLEAIGHVRLGAVQERLRIALKGH